MNNAKQYIYAALHASNCILEKHDCRVKMSEVLIDRLAQCYTSDIQGITQETLIYFCVIANANLTDTEGRDWNRWIIAPSDDGEPPKDLFGCAMHTSNKNIVSIWSLEDGKCLAIIDVREHSIALEDTVTLDPRSKPGLVQLFKERCRKRFAKEIEETQNSSLLGFEAVTMEEYGLVYLMKRATAELFLDITKEQETEFGKTICEHTQAVVLNSDIDQISAVYTEVYTEPDILFALCPVPIPDNLGVFWEGFKSLNGEKLAYSRKDNLIGCFNEHTLNLIWYYDVDKKELFKALRFCDRTLNREILMTNVLSLFDTALANPT